MPKKKESSWEEIGKQIGAKIEKEFKSEKNKSWKANWHIHEDRGGAFFGKALLGLGLYFGLSSQGLWPFAWWASVLILLGFALMKL